MVNEKDYITEYLDEVNNIANLLNHRVIEQIIDVLYDTRQHGGRVFVLGIGGSAANASHMVNDLRKICEIEAYAPTDNISELTARANDEGFANIFVPWLRNSKLSNKDCLFILSVGGEYRDPRVSTSIIDAIDYAHQEDIESMVLGICGDSRGWLATYGDYVVVVPEVNPKRKTPHTEEWQAILWHLVVMSPDLQKNKTTW